MCKEESGFSVLEAIIAIAIMSLALLPLLSLQGQFFKAVEGMERAEIRLGSRDEVLNYLKSLNLWEQPHGEFVLHGVRVSWNAVPVFEPRMSRGASGGLGRFEMTLYDVQVSIHHEEMARDDFVFRGLGWRSTRDLFDGF